jgi:hypothetical protein
VVAAANPALFHASPVGRNFSKANRLGCAMELDLKSAHPVAGVIREAGPSAETVENLPAYTDTSLFGLITDGLDEPVPPGISG